MAEHEVVGMPGIAGFAALGVLPGLVCLEVGDQVSLRSSPGRRTSMMDRSKSASSRRLALSVSSMPSWARHERQVVSLISRLISVIVALACGLAPQARSPVSVAAWVAP